MEAEKRIREETRLDLRLKERDDGKVELSGQTHSVRTFEGGHPTSKSFLEMVCEALERDPRPKSEG